VTSFDPPSLPPDSAPDPDRLLSSYDYELPESQIAQNPVEPRDRSRLLVVDSASESDRLFGQIGEFLRSGDLLVLNNSRVIPARLRGQKLNDGQVGSPIEILLLEELAEADRWLALVKPGRRLKPGATIGFGPNLELTAKIIATDEATGGRMLQFLPPPGTRLWDWIDRLGEMPLPPYITESNAHPDRYQTVYNNPLGSVAAPTAGLHFTSELLASLEAQGISHCFVTLHVGVGTFRPVEAEVITDHQMHGEWAEVSAETIGQIEACQARGGRVIAVGTTSVRALEGAAKSGALIPTRQKVNLFIYPGYEWQVVDGLITNFHLPKSSLMMLVSALIGRDRLLTVYQGAIDRGYRFYSFGDAMFVMRLV
jgi:S-adenosylmethionine:tRNA ribosyltransferase-isomerase